MKLPLTRRAFLKLGASAALIFAIKPGELMAAPVMVPALMYHDIGDAVDGYTVSPAVFSAEMEWLYSMGWRAVSLSELAGLSDMHRAKAFVITFDDGYASFIDYAFHLFEQYRFKSVINVIGRHAGGHITDNGAQKPMLSWDEYRHLIKSGLVDIGSHTYDLHSYGSGKRSGALAVPRRVLTEDLLRFQEVIKAETGKPTDILAWPYGLYDKESIGAAAAAGFKYMLTSDEGYISGRLDGIPRINIGNGIDLKSFRKIFASGRRVP